MHQKSITLLNLFNKAESGLSGLQPEWCQNKTITILGVSIRAGPVANTPLEESRILAATQRAKLLAALPLSYQHRLRLYRIFVLPKATFGWINRFPTQATANRLFNALTKMNATNKMANPCIRATLYGGNTHCHPVIALRMFKRLARMRPSLPWTMQAGSPVKALRSWMKNLVARTISMEMEIQQQQCDRHCRFRPFGRSWTPHSSQLENAPFGQIFQFQTSWSSWVAQSHNTRTNACQPGSHRSGCSARALWSCNSKCTGSALGLGGQPGLAGPSDSQKHTMFVLQKYGTAVVSPELQRKDLDKHLAIGWPKGLVGRQKPTLIRLHHDDWTGCRMSLSWSGRCGMTKAAWMVAVRKSTRATAMVQNGRLVYIYIYTHIINIYIYIYTIPVSNYYLTTEKIRLLLFCQVSDRICAEWSHHSCPFDLEKQGAGRGRWPKSLRILAILVLIIINVYLYIYVCGYCQLLYDISLYIYVIWFVHFKCKTLWIYTCVFNFGFSNSTKEEIGAHSIKGKPWCLHIYAIAGRELMKLL